MKYSHSTKPELHIWGAIVWLIIESQVRLIFETETEVCGKRSVDPLTGGAQ